MYTDQAIGSTSTVNGVVDPFQAAQALQPDCKDPYKLFGPICLELSNPGMITCFFYLPIN